MFGSLYQLIPISCSILGKRLPLSIVHRPVSHRIHLPQVRIWNGVVVSTKPLWFVTRPPKMCRSGRLVARSLSPMPSDMHASSLYELVVTGPAARAIQRSLPEAVAVAVIGFITGPLLDDPRRVGAPLRGGLERVWSALRGTYRILYRVHDEQREVIVLRVGHRRDVYRSP